MAVAFLKYFFDAIGLNLRSSDINRTSQFLSGGKNAIFHPNGGFKTRPGWQRKTGSQNVINTAGHLGIFKFDTTDILLKSKSEVIGFGITETTLGAEPTQPWRLKAGTFTITNDHSGPLTLKLYADAAYQSMRFYAFDGATELTSFDVTGTNLTAFKSSIDASPYLSMSTPAYGAADAEGIDFIDDVVVAAGASHTCTYYYWEQVNVPSHTLLSHLGHGIDDWASENFRNISCVSLNGVMYISSPPTHRPYPILDYLYKYDGQTYYSAGLPEPDSTFIIGSAPVAVSTAQTDVTGAYTLGGTGVTGTYKYAVTYICVDRAGQIIESDLFTDLTPRSPANQFVAIQAPQVFQDLKLFNCNQAFVNGAQSNVLTLTVDNGGMSGDHRIDVGDIAYFYSTNQSQFVTREVIAVTATSITISSEGIDPDDGGGTVSVRDNAHITNNMRAALWRTKNGGSAYFLVKEIPFGIYTTITTTNRYFDATPDNELGAEYIIPPQPHTLPPAGRYLSKFNDKLIISGNDFEPRRVYWSDETPEYFPVLNALDLPDTCTGHFQSGDVLIAGTKKTIHAVSGDLVNYNFRVDEIASNVGIISHHSIQMVDESVAFFLTDKGPYSLTAGRNLQPLGASPEDPGSSILEPYFTKNYDQTIEHPDFDRAISGLIKKQKLYILFIPWVTPAAPRYATSNSIAFIFDYGRGAWLPPWTNIDMVAGILDNGDGNIIYGGRTNQTYPSTLAKTNVLSGRLSYADHANPVDFQIKHHWEHLGSPNTLKKFVRIMINSLGDRISSSMTLGIKIQINYDESLEVTDDTVILDSSKVSLPIKLKASKCKALRTTFEASTMHQETVIAGYELEAVPGFQGLKK